MSVMPVNDTPTSDILNYKKRTTLAPLITAECEEIWDYSEGSCCVQAFTNISEFLVPGGQNEGVLS